VAAISDRVAPPDRRIISNIFARLLIFGGLGFAWYRIHRPLQGELTYNGAASRLRHDLELDRSHPTAWVTGIVCLVVNELGLEAPTPERHRAPEGPCVKERIRYGKSYHTTRPKTLRARFAT
jgi:hypothetical protein